MSNMRRVKLIKEIVVEEVPASGDMIEVHSFGPIPICLGDGSFAPMMDDTYERSYVPIHRIVNCYDGKRDELYIGYTKEAQELLGMPFDALYEEAKHARYSVSKMESKVVKMNKDISRLNDYRQRVKWAGLIDRLKYLIGLDPFSK